MTRLLFQEDSYLKEADAEVLEMVDGSLVLDRTIFYPQGGGQDTDRGHMMLNGIVHPIDEVKRASGKILHMSSVPFVGAGPGDVARMTLDWDRRYTMMRYHTALHLLSSVAYKDF
ncbi:MAG TPA: alanyl-tRNA editing protein, partial [Candidatus Methanofastidiosa archaeon]|nr:alanyl-tRNA editing protein [Candidatus Methanofastidiosa archaeon]